jgi:hypothetical protein
VVRGGYGTGGYADQDRVVPVTAGEGVIHSFSGAVAAVTAAMGFRSFVTECCDVCGIFEAHKKEADILFMSVMTGISHLS